MTYYYCDIIYSRTPLAKCLAFNLWTFPTLIQKNHPLVPFYCLWSPFWTNVFILLPRLADMFYIFLTSVPWLLMALSAPWKLCSWIPAAPFKHKLHLVSVLALVKHLLWMLGLHNHAQSLKGRSPPGLTYSCELDLDTFPFSPKHTVEKQYNLVDRVQTQEPRCMTLGNHFHVFTYKLGRAMPTF